MSLDELLERDQVRNGLLAIAQALERAAEELHALVESLYGEEPEE